MRITTETGSVYEIDEENKRIRRVTGKTSPTRRFSDEGWRSYIELTIPPQVGQRMLVSWCPNVGNGDSSTLTSCIVSIEGVQ